MKKLMILFTTVVFLTGCSSTTFYQLYSTKSPDVQSDESKMTFENEDVRVIYNFWDNFGTSSFVVFNKTGADIFIDLSKSHLIVNGIATTYFQNRTFTESSRALVNTGFSFGYGSLNKISNYNGDIRFMNDLVTIDSQENTNSTGSFISTNKKSVVEKGQSITYVEKKIICIPANSAKLITGIPINSELYRDCDLFRYPSRNNIKAVKFTEGTTPLTIKNILSYRFDENDKENHVIENNFWISEISNYSLKSFLGKRYPEYCGEKAQEIERYYLFSGANKFYIRYTKQTSSFKH
ncbi:MAG: hypothetical protein AB7V25_00380 [Mangrovibacterium sp.]